jgi:hypothetical protein
MKKRGIVFWLLIVITMVGLAAAARILFKRAAYEKANRTVEVAIDLPSLAAQIPARVDEKSVVRRLSSLGILAYGVYEFKAKELLDNHDLLYYRAWPESIAAEQGMEKPGNVLLKVEGAWAGPMTEKFLNAYFGRGACDPAQGLCLVPDIGSKIEDLTFGLHWPGMDVSVVPRFFNTPFENRATIREKMRALDVLKPSVIIFDGETALGFPELLDVTAGEILKRPGWNVGLVDMVVQDGVKQLAWKLPGRVMPVHSIPEEEMGKNPPSKALTRYRRAVRERGIRLLYVRLYTPDYFGKSAMGALEENIKYLKDLTDGLKSDGYTIGEARPLQPFIVRRVTRAACVAGAVAFAGLLCWIGFGLPGLLALLGAIASFLIVMFMPETGAVFKYFIKLAALGVACAAPGLAVSLLFLGNTTRSDKYFPFRHSRESGNPFEKREVYDALVSKLEPGGTVKFGVGEAVARWAASCALTIAGGVFVAAMLSDREYFLRMNVFSGVKIAFLVPLLIVFLSYLNSTGEKILEFFDSPMKYIEVAIGLAALAVLAVYLLRSGNQPGPGAMTEQESALRTALESLFYARPRFKEFLIGHPAMILVGLIPLGRKRYAGLLLILLGVMGQVSLFNSFCHLHTPIEMTYLRSVIGMILGLVIGLGLRVCGTAALWKFSKK